MASGIIDLGTSGNLKGRLVWTSASNGSAANTSTINVSIQACKTSNTTIGTTGTFGTTITIGEETKNYSRTMGIDPGVWKELTTFSATVNHDSDGTGTCNIYGRITGPAGTSLGGTSVSGSETVTLETIPRHASISSAPNFTDEDNPKITYSNPAGDAVTTLQACISTDGTTAYISYRNISKTGKSYTFTLTDNERKQLREATKTANTKKVYFMVKSSIGGEEKISKLSKTLTIKDPKPTLNPEIVDSNADTIALTGNNQNLVRYHSDAQITFNAAAVKEATLKSKQVTCGKGTRITDGIISSVESGTFKFSVTDSRGNTTEKTETLTLVKYVKLTCNMVNTIPNGEGEMTVQASGNCFKGSFGAVSNTLEVKYRYKPNGSILWTDWTDMTVTWSGNKYTAEANITDLDYQAAYVFQIQAKDKLATVTSDDRTVKATPVFDWGEDDFRFNVPITFPEGNGYASPVPHTRKLNGYDLSADRNLTVEDIGAVNPNLLDNWYFGNPVNQRGYFSPNPSAIEYFIDRWLRYGTATMYTVDAEGITVSSDGTETMGIFQRIPAADLVPGQKYTLSALVKVFADGNNSGTEHNLILSYGVTPSGIEGSKRMARTTTSIGRWKIVSFTFTLPTAESVYNFRIRSNTAGSVMYSVKAMKLEKGEKQTLGRKNGDEWELAEIPNYADHLLRCQRYYLPTSEHFLTGYTSSTDGTAYFCIMTPVPLRAEPTIGDIVSIRAICEGSAKSVSIVTATVDGWWYGGVRVKVTYKTGVLATAISFNGRTASAGYSLNAEL